MVFLGLPSRKNLALHGSSKSTTRKSCKWCIRPENTRTPIRKRPVRLCRVDSGCLVKNNNIYWHTIPKCKHPELEMKVSQLTTTKHILSYLFTLKGLILIRNPSKSSNFLCHFAGDTAWRHHSKSVSYLNPDWFRWFCRQNEAIRCGDFSKTFQ